MDGYAVRCTDAAASERLAVSAQARIGRAPPALVPGTAVHIVTGAPVPAGADAVIRREDVRERGDEIELLPAARQIKPGTALRRRGENAASGEDIVAAGVLIGPATVGALASFGITRVRVHRRVRVAVITTGDEVVDASETPSAWMLRDSNGPGVAAMLGRLTWAEVVSRERVADDLAAIERAIRRALGEADAMFLTGGVSMGDRDHVPAAVRSAGAEAVFHKVPQRPGKPVLGAVSHGRPVLALPGNPVSVLVTARRIGVPVLERVAGLLTGAPPPLVSAGDDGKRIDLWWHRIARLSGPGRAELTDGRGSGDVPSAARSDGFIEVPPGESAAGPWPFFEW
jgi:molybdopterin molybdotransferase